MTSPKTDEFPPDPPPDVLERLSPQEPHKDDRREHAAWSGARYGRKDMIQPDLFGKGKGRKL